MDTSKKIVRNVNGDKNVQMYMKSLCYFSKNKHKKTMTENNPSLLSFTIYVILHFDQ